MRQLRRGRCAVYALDGIAEIIFVIIAVIEELRHPAFVAQCGTWALSSRRRRASLQDLFTVGICSVFFWEVLCLPGGAALSSTDKRL